REQALGQVGRLHNRYTMRRGPVTVDGTPSLPVESRECGAGSGLLDGRKLPLVGTGAGRTIERPEFRHLLRLGGRALDHAASLHVDRGIDHLVAHGDGGVLAGTLAPSLSQIALQENRLR